ncbi:MAG: NAD(P)/FAD-dependent oxidoreductase [Spirochaetaceae bacterium]|nr:NAD(P)/FAD-dependent oxidoreductase [Spirochaetaceae bacterium]
MRQARYDAVVIGGGAAGMAAAIELNRRGHSVAILEREETLGGILMQCIHNGFGLIEFNEELSGPEFAQRLETQVRSRGISAFLCTTVLDIREEGGTRAVYCVSPAEGVSRIEAGAVLLAMGCRERNRGNIRIPGTRPAGVYTAGLAQRLVNIEGYIPGKDVVIVGSGDIGLIMARRMTWAGCKVHAVIEILPYPSGLTRNIVQCLEDFGIPLYLSHLVTDIVGEDRVEGVEVTPIEQGALMHDKAFRILCDTVLLSVGLVPENELSRAAGIDINPATNGPVVDSMLMTSMPGVFACGNVLHVHDLVDYVVEEARRAGAAASEWLAGYRPEAEIRVKAGANIRYVLPGRLNPARENRLYMRPLIVRNDCRLELKVDGKVVRSIRKAHVQPSEMLSMVVTQADLAQAGRDSVVEIALA